MNDQYPDLTFNEQGECSFCEKDQHFKPIGEQALVDEFGNARKTARKRKLDYDVLVPLSGGKDSTFMLYLAARKYKLTFLAMTYDNGFLSPLTLKNIQTTVKNAGEITRDHAMKMLMDDNLWEMPANVDPVIEYLDVTKKELAEICAYKPLTYEKYTSRMNRLYGKVKKIK